MATTTQIDLNRVRNIQNLDLLARQLVEGFITGLHKSPFHGFSVEFAEHRLYNDGESTRHIDWKVYAKSDRLFVKRYEEETNLRCHILLDTSSSMYYPQDTYGKITFSVLAAASIANLLQRQKDAVSLTTFAETVEVQTPVKSTPSHIHKIILELEKVFQRPPGSKKTETADIIHLIAKKIHKRSLVVIFSDMFDNMEDSNALFSALQHLKHNNHEVLIFHVTDHATEKDFDFEERPYEFIDLESGNSIKVQPSQVKEVYQNKVKSYFHELYLKCGQYKIDLIQVDIAKGVEPVLMSYLAKRAKMK